MLTIISTFKNKEDNLGILYEELFGVLRRFPFSYEILLVNDNSRDNSRAVAEKICSENPHVYLLNNDGPAGRGWALATGLKRAKGDLIIFLDSDTQDNPADVPKFLEKLPDGYDLVQGYRYSARYPLLVRLYSAVFNWFLRTFFRSPFHDINCGFKGFKRSVLEKTKFDPETFRFFPLAVAYDGFKVTEVQVENRPLIYGDSKFKVRKIFRGFGDFFRFWKKRKK